MPKTKKEKYLKPFFARVGGKRHIADIIIEKAPAHETYVEAFVGGGSVFLKKPLAPINVINDLDKNIYDLWNDFKTINPIDYSFDPSSNANSEIFDKYITTTEYEDPNERFKRNIFLNKYSFNGNMIFKCYKKPESWRKQTLKGLKDNFTLYKDKMKDTKVENIDFREIIKKYDDYKTFFYFDPPYSKNCKYWNYGNDLKVKDMKEALVGIKARFVLSYDDNEEVENVFKDDYYLKRIETTYQVKGKGNKKVSELLISNFDLS
jgi:DNA adenine methylase